MKFLLGNIVALSVILTVAAVHGRWTHRWTPFDRDLVTARLEQIPMVFGDWKGQSSPSDDISTWRDEMDLGEVRRYTNRVTGASVVVMLRGGPPGPIGQHHTPASCYRAVGFVDRGRDQKREVSTASHQENTFWVSAFEKPGPIPQRVRVFWGYSGGKGWVAPTNPRIELGAYDVCFKVYVIRNINDPNESLDGDYCEDFLREALPVIDSVLFPVQAGS